MAAEQREQAEATRSRSEMEDDPVDDPEDDPVDDPEDEDKDEDDEDEEEEEDPGYDDLGDDDEDDDSPLASSQRPVTWSIPKKKLVPWPKMKAYRNQSGPGSSSQKRTQDR